MAKTYRPLSLTDALRIRNAEHALVLAGGTDLMAKRGGFPPASRLVLCIGHLQELRQISRHGENLILGAACTIAELLASPLLPEYLKIPLAEMASPAIRNVATIGGNLCNASSAADTLPMLYALDAWVCLQSVDSFEELPVAAFIGGPGQTRLGHGQLLTEIRIPLHRNWRCTYRKIGSRKANSISKLSMYAVSDGRERRLRDIRIAFGAIAPTVVRSREAERAFLEGCPSQTPELLQQIAGRYAPLIQPIDDVRSNREYRRTVAMQLLVQYLTEEMSL